MLTKQQIKMMIKDVGEEYINISHKMDKYRDLNLPCSIVSDLKQAWNVLDLVLENLHNDLRAIELEDNEEKE